MDNVAKFNRLKLKLMKPFNHTEYFKMGKELSIYNNCTPIHSAVKTGKVELVEKVFSLGANIWLTDGAGKYAFEIVRNMHKSKPLEDYLRSLFSDLLDLLELEKVVGERVIYSSVRRQDDIREFVDNGWFSFLKRS